MRLSTLFLLSLPALAAPCPISGTLQNLLDLKSCTIAATDTETIIFSNFVYTSQVDASKVTFTLQTDAAVYVKDMCPGYGFLFDFEMVPLVGQTLVSTLQFVFTPIYGDIIPDEYWSTMAFSVIDWSANFPPGPHDHSNGNSGIASSSQTSFYDSSLPTIASRIVRITAAAISMGQYQDAYVHQVQAVVTDGVHADQTLCEKL